MSVKKSFYPAIIGVLVVVSVGSLVGWRLLQKVTGGQAEADLSNRPVPVEVARIERASVAQRRTYSGALEAAATFRVASKVGGRVARLTVDLADPVTNGLVVAELDADEYQQALRRAEADLAVASAELSEARAVVEITGRTLERQESLRVRGVASEVAVDEAQSAHLAAQAQVAVAEAGVTRAEAAVATAQTQLGYTRVRAVWQRGDDQRLVAERLVEEGDTVSANAELLEVVELDPLMAVMFVAQRDYAALSAGQAVALRTDAYPNEAFAARVARVSPVFASGSRQARVELEVPNADRRLRPGMFVRAETVLVTVDDATVVPVNAVVRRGDRPVVFVFDEATQTAKLMPVEIGVEDAGRVQVISGDLPVGGWVVTLGQRLLDDGSAVKRVDDPAEAATDASTEIGE